MTAYDYARVSTNGQDLAAQEAELLAAGASKVFKEKVSGAKVDRAELAKVIRRLEPGDPRKALHRPIWPGPMACRRRPLAG